MPAHPSARETVDDWAKRNGCGGRLEAAGTRDIHSNLEGAETDVRRVAGCTPPVELWTVRGGGHHIGAQRAALSALYRTLTAAAPASERTP
jgi:poly(3-hydroxybutyrate) depolymerase